MFKYSKDGVSVLSTIDPRRPLKNGLFPVKIQVVNKRKQRYYSTGIDLTLEEWNKLKGTKNRKLIDIRNAIENSFFLVRNNVEALVEKGEFAFDTLKSRLRRGTVDKINDAFKVKVRMLEKEERLNTRNTYIYALKAIEKFAGESIEYDSITIDWLRNFERFLRKDKTITTVGIYMRNLRVIMNDAITSGVIKESQYPFGKNKYQIKKGNGKKIALSLKEIKKIVNFSDGSETTEKYKDLWLFQFFCNGINIADLIELKFKNIRDGEIVFIRQKTKRTNNTEKEIKVIINAHMERIIKKWGNKPSVDNWLFRFNSATLFGQTVPL